MSTINISLPDEMQSWVEEEVRAGGFDGAGEFFRQLVREAKARKETQKRQTELEALLIEGIESEPEVADARWWSDLRAEMETELVKHRSQSA